ncbi:hypothetical protein CK203_047279 [Vitis vinifera]|uniref:Uncharacterized protein n=1 Tax=Vitis vinifera TaxID=29760 RepID=A0A438HZ21_VITVI|nr:hypothetical protein CK203_047279 [Vitis vinifera]
MESLHVRKSPGKARKCMCGGDDHLAWKLPVSLEVCRGLRTAGGRVYHIQYGLPLWIRIGEDYGPSLPLLTLRGRSLQEDIDQEIGAISSVGMRPPRGYQQLSRLLDSNTHPHLIESFYIIPSTPSPTNYYSFYTKTDATILSAGYAFETSFSEAHGG